MVRVDPVHQQARRRIRDDSIMGTNNSSIVSKRSVESLYYPEPHFFRYFVKRRQRRSPLINRGYWLRMHAIDHVLQKFLQEPTPMRKVVINMGCGYDPLPFQSLAKQKARCEDVLFIDVDYPQLMQKKTDIVLNTPQLLNLLGGISTPSAPVFLQSEFYLAVGCDLRELEKLEAVLFKWLEPSRCIFLVTAEVSVTYMDVQAADALISWAAKFNNVRFCLLEQFLPNGPNHPFAQTMINHFDKLQTPLMSISRYPSLDDQLSRFEKNGGWPSVIARSLWDLWSDDAFLTRQQRIALNAVEPFDEYEEFALFASHYFLLMAVNGTKPHHNILQLQTSRDKSEMDRSSMCTIHLPGSKINGPTLSMPRLKCTHYPQLHTGARYGAILPMDEDVIGHHGGIGLQHRLSSTDLYTLGETKSSRHVTQPSTEPGARMCHTITNFQDTKCLLVGGRASPDDAFADCWSFSNNVWERTEELPNPLYKHSATFVRDTNNFPGVLVYGGKSSTVAVMNDWLLWQEGAGWKKLNCTGDIISPRYGAAIANNRVGTGGILLGGMSEDGVVLAEIWEWSFVCTNSVPKIVITNVTRQLKREWGSIVYRFGAYLTWSSNCLMLVGGILGRKLLEDELDVLGLVHSSDGFPNDHGLVLCPFLVYDPSPANKALLIGHSVFSNMNGSDPMIMVGGGAVCFSFGTYWNKGIWMVHDTCHLNMKIPRLLAEPWANVSNHNITSTDSLDKQGFRSESLKEASVLIPRQRCESAISFEAVVSHSKPAALEGLDLGPCVNRWSLEYLKESIGPERLVVVHEATSPHMNFHTKNFMYSTKKLEAFLQSIESGGNEYLRSLASEQPANNPAVLATDYPKLAHDFQLPKELQTASRNIHSAVLRISGPVTMWLHYDVMANVLCQIQGFKRLILFPPSDIMQLGIPPGSSSSSINVFNTDVATRSSLELTHPHEVLLKPGDVLFIPPLWSHTASPCNGTSVAVNVFFRNLRVGYAAGRDVYGNRDLQAYERGRKDVEKIARAFDGLPRDVRGFYLERLVAELQQKI